MVTGVLRRPCSKPVGWCMRLDELECIQTSEQTLQDSSGSFIFGPLHPKPGDYGGWWGTFPWQGDEKINVFNLLSWSWQLFTVENKVNKVRDSSELFLILIVIVILSCGPQRDQAVVPDGTLETPSCASTGRFLVCSPLPPLLRLFRCGSTSCGGAVRLPQSPLFLLHPPPPRLHWSFSAFSVFLVCACVWSLPLMNHACVLFLIFEVIPLAQSL